MSMNREDEARKALRKDVGGEYKLEQLETFHVKHLNPKQAEWERCWRQHAEWLKNKAV